MFSSSRPRQIVLWILGLTLALASCQLGFAQTDDPADGETDPVKLFERGQNAHAKGDLARAVSLYEGALKLRPEFAEAEYQRGVALVSLERFPEAEKSLNHAIELKKDWSLPMVALGSLLARAERDRDAEPVLRRAIKLGANDYVTLDSLSSVRLRAGDKVEALSLAHQATEDENAPASAWTWRASVERANRDSVAALSSLSNALKIEPNHVSAFRERAELRIEARDYEHAIEDLKTALALKPEDKQISIRLANVYDLAGKPDDAQRLYQSVGVTRAAPPPPGRSLGNQIQLLEGTNEEIEAANSDDPARARPAVEKLLAKNPKNAGLFARLGEITRRSDPVKSAESYRRANEIDPANPKYATGYGAALVQLRRFTEAEALLRRVIALAPDDYTAHANLALALYELKRYAEALPEYDWLAASRPEIAATYFFMATARDNLGEYEQALDAYQKFLARADPVNNKLDIDKVNLRLPRLRDQINRGQGTKRKKP
jgi:tetratricopeptide (TPR) repeat protein